VSSATEFAAQAAQASIAGGNAPVAGTGPAARKPRAGAEAARYGVLRRLAPALKHDMVVNLQAISMMAEVMNARLERGNPTLADFQTNISKLSRLARDAVANCLKVAAWIEPGEDTGVRLRDGVDECLSLLASNFNFRSFEVTTEVAETDFQVWRVALRHLLVASLVVLTDAVTSACRVSVKADVVNGMAEIAVDLTPLASDTETMVFEPGYRHLEWADVQALAAAEAVELTRGPDRIVMRMPRAVPTAPLQIAPV
jgi:C4-dicarboxylate-specific signal transduction histidine kinase